MRAEQVVARCRELAHITDVEGETTRTFLSPAMRRANDRVAQWMGDAGMTVATDAAGNLRGRIASASPNASTFVIASHLDTVPNAGAFDGVLGVVMGVAIAEALRTLTLPFHLEVIGFSEEEGVRFGAPFLGSRALGNDLDDAILSRTDANGVSVRQAIRDYGLDDTKLDAAKLANPLGYFEIHIEQGPLLESGGQPLAVVDAIVGQSRYEIAFHGQSNHAGTTPMPLRHDAMAAAAEWIVAVEQYAQGCDGLVATNGTVQTMPGAGNIIAAEVRVSLDVRSASDSERGDAVRHLLVEAGRCSAARGVSVTHSQRMNQAAVAMDASLTRLLEEAVSSTGAKVLHMASGAGHDAMIAAAHMPAAMLLLRTPRGLSHHPDEDVLPGDVQLGLDAGVAFVRALAGQEECR